MVRGNCLTSIEIGVLIIHNFKRDKDTMLRISALLLGAGESKRMGFDKLTLPWRGKTVFEYCLDNLLRSDVKEVIVVINNKGKSESIMAKGPKVKITINPDFKEGMSSSIRRGLKRIDRRSHGILIALGDQPLLKTRTINSLIHAFSLKGGGIIVPCFKGKRGNPVIFHRRFERELLGLRGDTGGRSIVEKHPDEVTTVRVRSAGILKDIDTWKDYKNLVKMRRLFSNGKNCNKLGRRLNEVA